MEERRRFAAAKIAGEYDSFAELCRAFGISRKTGYKWWARFEEGGLEALYDRSHRVRSHPFTTDPVKRFTTVRIAFGRTRSRPIQSWSKSSLRPGRFTPRGAPRSSTRG
ncbi:MAG: helix-turn-helix domain-containing protein [Deltaproteobacteria bacterium]|nr:helix-turn-helix domain-containing protein [Deltaproteobacteria bacterium]